MPVSREEVRRTARLARLALTAAEEERLARELGRILEHIEALAEADAGRPEDGGSPEPAEAAPLHAGVASPDALALPPSALAPAWEDGFFTVPRLAALEGPEDGPAG